MHHVYPALTNDDGSEDAKVRVGAHVIGWRDGRGRLICFRLGGLLHMEPGQFRKYPRLLDLREGRLERNLRPLARELGNMSSVTRLYEQRLLEQNVAHLVVVDTCVGSRGMKSFILFCYSVLFSRIFILLSISLTSP